MNILVTYASKYGSTERYARAIAQALGCEARKSSQVTAPELKRYDVLIHGGGLYAGGLSGIQLLTKNRQVLASKQVILFTCGIADPADPKNIAHIEAGIVKALPPELGEHVRQFHLRGILDYPRLSLLHRVMMAALRNQLLKKGYENLRGEDRLLVDTYGGRVDYLDEASITPLVDYVKGL